MKAGRVRRIAVVGAVGVTLIAGSLIATSGVAVARTSLPATCSATRDDPWPAWVQGRPAVVAPQTHGGVYLWHDYFGWHIRVTHYTATAGTFSVRVTTPGAFVGIRPTRLGTRHSFLLSAARHDITFAFSNSRGVSGLNFFTRCAPSITFDFASSGSTVPSTMVTVGHDGTNSSTDPFTVTRSTTPGGSTTTDPTTTTATSTTTTTTTTLAA